jgi:hypothetical protein
MRAGSAAAAIAASSSSSTHMHVMNQHIRILLLLLLLPKLTLLQLMLSMLCCCCHQCWVMVQTCRALCRGVRALHEGSKAASSSSGSSRICIAAATCAESRMMVVWQPRNNIAFC